MARKEKAIHPVRVKWLPPSEEGAKNSGVKEGIFLLQNSLVILIGRVTHGA